MSVLKELSLPSASSRALTNALELRYQEEFQAVTPHCLPTQKGTAYDFFLGQKRRTTAACAIVNFP
jgi:hypothetical protein